VLSSAEVVRSLYEAFGRGDIATVLDLLDPQVHWHEAEGSPYHPGRKGWVGPDAVVSNLFEKMGADWTSFSVLPERFHEAGPVVTVEGRYAATHAVTGRALDCQMCHVWTVEDGRIIRFQQYTDTAQMQEVMGSR
jgi:ketosteroid isomerase-like protein